MSADYEVWFRQYTQITDALAPHVFEVDGQQVVDPSAVQPAILRTYHMMRSVGYAKGWL